MVEIRGFDGTAAELSAFVVTTWRKSYEGEMPFPLWSGDFLERELLLDGNDRPYVVAAYDGTKLVACHPGRPITIRIHGEAVGGSLGSFLSVDPDYRRQGIACRMQEEFARRHRERGDKVNFGYLYLRYRKSMGKQFWLKQPEGVVPVRRVGHWVRAFDYRAVAQWELWRPERWGSRVLSMVHRPITLPRDTSGIRRWRPEDLPACLELVQQAGQSADIAYVWDATNLDRQLHYKDLARTIVIEHDGCVAGLINYSRFDVLGKTTMATALVDLIAFGTLPQAERKRLLRAAMAQMVEEGLKAAILLRGSWYAWRTLAGAGFFPMPREYYFTGVKIQKDVRLENVRQLHVLWR